MLYLLVLIIGVILVIAVSALWVGRAAGQPSGPVDSSSGYIPGVSDGSSALPHAPCPVLPSHHPSHSSGHHHSDHCGHGHDGGSSDSGGDSSGGDSGGSSDGGGGSN
jgi:hypothetical protein